MQMFKQQDVKERVLSRCTHCVFSVHTLISTRCLPACLPVFLPSPLTRSFLLLLCMHVWHTVHHVVLRHHNIKLKLFHIVCYYFWVNVCARAPYIHIMLVCHAHVFRDGIVKNIGDVTYLFLALKAEIEMI